MRTDLDDGDQGRQEVGVMSVDRFATLLYGVGEAAGYLSVPPTTLQNWVYGHPRPGSGARGPAARPIIAAEHPERRNESAMPFIGLAEAYALAEIGRAHV